MKKTINILIVDDNQDFCLNVQDVLELRGYGTEIATDGFAALDIVKNKKMDLVLLDIKMPLMNGVETFKKIKKISPSSLTIMMTAFAVEELIKESLENGAFGVLHKPIDFDKLFSLIEMTRAKGSLILVVDDDQLICSNMEDLLTGRGFSVNCAFDGDSAIQLVEESKYDVMILDLKLPPLNGFEVYTKIREFRPNLVVILITGYLGELSEQVETILKKDVYACLEKPIDMDQIFQMLEAVIKEKK